MSTTNNNASKSSFLDKFTMVAVKLGSQVHMRSLRDAFALIMPLFILAGLAVFINYVVFDWFFKGETLAKAQLWGSYLINGTLNISGLLITPAVAYSLSQNKGYKNPLACAVVSIAALIIMMPKEIMATPVGGNEAVKIANMLSFSNLGTTGMFAGIIMGLLTTELLIWVSGVKRLTINMGDNIPPAVGRSFNVMIPIILVLSFFALVSVLLLLIFNTDLITLISTMIQEPLRKINTSLIGTVTIYSIGNFLFTLGIHQSVVNGVLLDPLLLANMNENMLALANGEAIPHIINAAFVPTFGMVGGTGSTISLIIATFIFSKYGPSRDIAKLSTAPGLFNINEPVIFGYPIVFNLPMMIPFVSLPAIGIIFAYFATAMGFMNHCVVYTPWTTPPLLSAYFATGGDWRAVVVQLIIIVGGAFFYLPFMKVSERVQKRMAENQTATS